LPVRAAFDDLLGQHGNWLARGQLSETQEANEALTNVLATLGIEARAAGLAALRLWGQTGERPVDWVCAADPVYLEAMLDHVRLHTLSAEILDAADRQRLFEILQCESGDAARHFVQVGEHGYVRSAQPFATAAHSSLSLHAGEPDEFLPAGPAAHDHDRLIGEVQLLLHESPLNRDRETRGLAPVNSLWLWGGGHAPPVCKRELPPLFANDPLFRGYWQCADAEVNDLPADFASFMTKGPTSFVAVLVASAQSRPAGARTFAHLRRQLLRGRLRQLTVVSHDGRILRLQRWQVFAFWRRRPLTSGLLS
jgi:hypothetical protein